MANRALKAFDIVVLGAGVNGLFAAYYLSRYVHGRRTLAVIDQFPVGHDRGSSHGPSRMTRSTYPDPRLVELMTYCRNESWPEVERDLDSTLVHECPAILFGPRGGLFDRYAGAVAKTQAPIERLDAETAHRRFPQFEFRGMEALEDRTGGLIDSGTTLVALKQALFASGVTLMMDRRIDELALDGDPIRLCDRSGNVVECHQLIVAAGGWTSKMIPELTRDLTVIRQTVGYFQPKEPQGIRLGEFPAWVYLGEAENDIFYGLPEFQEPGIKAAQHVTVGPSDDPDRIPLSKGPPGDRVHQFLDERLMGGVCPPLRTEWCLYTVTADENFWVQRHLDNPDVLIAAGFSGHGFKFGPLTGRWLAHQCCQDVPALPDRIQGLYRETFERG